MTDYRTKHEQEIDLLWQAVSHARIELMYGTPTKALEILDAARLEYLGPEDEDPEKVKTAPAPENAAV